MEALLRAWENPSIAVVEKSTATNAALRTNLVTLFLLRPGERSINDDFPLES
jgi:hypothetical protein